METTLDVPSLPGVTSMLRPRALDPSTRSLYIARSHAEPRASRAPDSWRASSLRRRGTGFDDTSVSSRRNSRQARESGRFVDADDLQLVQPVQRRDLVGLGEGRVVEHR